MPGKQLSISRSKEMIPVIEEALRTFPDASTEAQALTRALFHWLHSRQENSKRGAIDQVAKDVKRILGILEERQDNSHG